MEAQGTETAGCEHGSLVVIPFKVLKPLLISYILSLLGLKVTLIHLIEPLCRLRNLLTKPPRPLSRAPLRSEPRLEGDKNGAGVSG